MLLQYLFNLPKFLYVHFFTDQSWHTCWSQHILLCQCSPCCRLNIYLNQIKSKILILYLFQGKETACIELGKNEALIEGVVKIEQDQKSIDAIESNLVSEPGLIIDENIIEELTDGCSGPMV